MSTRMLTLATLSLVLNGCDETYGGLDNLDVDLATQRAKDWDPDRLTLEGQVVGLFSQRAPERTVDVQVVAVHRNGPVEVLAETHTEESGLYELGDLPRDLRAPLYLVVVNPQDDFPDVATRVSENLLERTQLGEAVTVDAYTVEPWLMGEILKDLRDLGVDLHIGDEGAILGSVRDARRRPIGRAQVGCEGCRETWYFDADPRDGRFSRSVFDLLDGVHQFDVPDLDHRVNRLTSEHADGLFLTSGPEFALLEARHPSELAWPRIGVPTMPGTITIVDLVALSPRGSEQPED